MQMRLPVLLRISDPLLDDILSLLDKLPMQINRIVRDAPRRVVLAEYVVRRLLVVLVHLRSVRLALLGQLVRQPSIAALVCLVRLPLRQNSELSTRFWVKGRGAYAVKT